jgi:tetratricopeptide (TPR) repeat protein
MTKYLYLLSALLVSTAIPAFAQGEPMAMSATAATSEASEADPVMEKIKPLQDEWARIKYQVADKEAQLAAIAKLEAQAAEVTAANPDRAEPKIWEAIILSTDAGITKGMSALPKVERAKTLLEASEKIDPNALNGSAHTSLGSLYYQVPGWPVGFGDDEKAEEHLKMGLQINPNGIDPNYFYGDFLLQEDRIEEAKTYLNRALQAQNRPGRELADAGRRQEVKAALAKADETLKSKKKDFN